MKEQKVNVLEAKIKTLELSLFEKKADLKGYMKVMKELGKDQSIKKAMDANIANTERTIAQQEVMLSSYKEDLKALDKEV